MTRPLVPAITVTQDFVTSLLVSALQQITGLPAGRVIVETRADRRPPEGLYCSLWFKELDPLVQNMGDFEFSAPGQPDSVAQVLDNESYCTVQIGMWGANAYARAVSAMQALQNAQRFADLWRVLGFAGIDQVQDLSAVYGAQIQQRASFNLSYYVCMGQRYPIDWFTSSQWERHSPLLRHHESFTQGGIRQ